VPLDADAYRQVKGRLDLAVTDLGPTQLKNIVEPIQVFSFEVAAPKLAKPAPTPAGEKTTPPRRRQPHPVVTASRETAESGGHMSDTLKEAALEYHRTSIPGKISVVPTKAMATQRDLALAYSPGVADACLAIVEDSLQAAELTARSNLVAVVTNGTAVLGLGNIGPLAGKPVMKGRVASLRNLPGSMYSTSNLPRLTLTPSSTR
jgi:Malic enzyme, N-terminal domain